MKAIFLRLAAALTLLSTAVSCTTMYDSYGNPRTVVTPEGAVLGAAAVGLLAYGIAESNNDRHRHRHYHGRHYHRRGYYY